MTVWESRVNSSPDNLFIKNLSNDTTYSYKEADTLSLNVSSAVQSLDGCSCLALLMPSCAEYVCLWLGLSRIGCTSALINTNLMGQALVHAVKTAVGGSKTKRIVVSEELVGNIEAVKGDLAKEGIEVGGGGGS
jgi:acyl-CoA synthetase (AMP-forming)/AMP-acid ligase II